MWYNRRMNTTQEYTLTQQQWELIDQKYGKLIYKIAHQISGDNAIASVEDNAQDLRIAAMEAVVGFTKQHSGKNGTFDEFWGTKGFDQYMKTVLWTKKNNKGAKITKRFSITKNSVSTDNEEGASVFQIADESYNPELELIFDELMDSLTPNRQEILNLIVKDPTLIKPNGKINVKKVSEIMNLSWAETKNEIEELQNSLN